MRKTLEVRKIGELSARLVREGGKEFVELFVRLPAAQADKAKRVKKRGKARRKARRGK